MLENIKILDYYPHYPKITLSENTCNVILWRKPVFSAYHVTAIVIGNRLWLDCHRFKWYAEENDFQYLTSCTCYLMLSLKKKDR